LQVLRLGVEVWLFVWTEKKPIEGDAPRNGHGQEEEIGNFPHTNGLPNQLALDPQVQIHTIVVETFETIDRL
jgi:hypothetical protein